MDPSPSVRTQTSAPDSLPQPSLYCTHAAPPLSPKKKRVKISHHRCHCRSRAPPRYHVPLIPSPTNCCPIPVSAGLSRSRRHRVLSPPTSQASPAIRWCIAAPVVDRHHHRCATLLMRNSLFIYTKVWEICLALVLQYYVCNPWAIMNTCFFVSLIHAQRTLTLRGNILV